jgi:uncharacterized protein (TIGR02145 family)
MKKTLLNTFALATLFFASAANAQVGVGVPAGDIHPSAELEVKSTTKGFLPPRMTNAERNAIISPATGLLIYQTDAVANNPAGLYFYDGTTWKNGLGVQGPQGLKGDRGAQGELGDAGSMPSGTSLGEMKYWDGTKWASLIPVTNGQILTYCEGLPTWTFNGKCPNGPNISDIDGNVYRTVNIGNQQWMAENLKVNRYNDGTDILNEPDPNKWSSLKTGAWAYYENNKNEYAKYGKLYNWYAVSPDNKNVCPTGWHVPTDAEWTILTEYLGGASVAGGKMKEVGTTNWTSPNAGANNVSLFSALPGGVRGDNGNCVEIGLGGFWWSSSDFNTKFAWYRYLLNSSGNAIKNNFIKEFGLSVRCLKD